jgi:hypothetical protein
MKVIAIFFVLVFCSSFVYAIEANFNCPSEVFVGEEFECTLIVQKIGAVQDVKIDISPGNKRITEVYSSKEGMWKSAFFYLYGHIGIEDEGMEKKIQLKVVEDFEGKVVGVLKFRESEDKAKTEFIDFDIKISTRGDGESEGDEEESDDPEEDMGEGDGGDEDDGEGEAEEEPPRRPEPIQSIEKVESEPQIIMLNSPSHVMGDDSLGQVVYESKNEKIRKYAPYAFSFFMILLFIVVVFMR